MPLFVSDRRAVSGVVVLIALCWEKTSLGNLLGGHGYLTRRCYLNQPRFRGGHVNNLESMLQRNQKFAAQQSAAGTLMPSLPRAMPNVKAIIIGCADMRVDPAHVLGIKPGEAVVIRNIGGRITPGLLEQLGLLGRIGEV